MTIENPLLAHSDGIDAEVLTSCACGCGEDVVSDYKALWFDGMWFYDTACLGRWLGAEWRIAK